MAYVSFVAQLLYVSENAGGVDVCLQMRGFTEIDLSVNIATSEDTAIGKMNVHPILLLCLLISPFSFFLAAGVDFEPQSVQLTFPPTNQTILDDLYQLPVAEQLTAPLPMSSPQCSRVAILDDDILEEGDPKLLRLSLTMGGPYVQFETPSTVLVTIVDDDGT